MNKRDAFRLIKALRSGKYKQGRDQLGAIDTLGKESNCCLGVLCRIKNRPRKAIDGKTVLYDGHDTYPNAERLIWLMMTAI